MSDPSIFSEQEVTKIIKRAVQLSEAESSPTYTPGVTRPELEKIASELGIAPSALAKAIEDNQGSQNANRPFRFVEEFERVVEGELDPSQFDIVTEVASPIARTGHARFAQIGRSLKFEAWAGTGQATVNVVSRNGRTKIQVRSTVFMQFLYTMYPAIITSVIITAASVPHHNFPLAAAFSSLILTLAGVAFNWTVKRGHQKAEELADRLRAHISEALASAPATLEPVASEPLEKRLNLEN
ncbi:MAG: hypothetical protein ACOYON_05685 [Fimbriimonas sp.]